MEYVSKNIREVNALVVFTFNAKIRAEKTSFLTFFESIKLTLNNQMVYIFTSDAIKQQEKK